MQRSAVYIFLGCLTMLSPLTAVAQRAQESTAAQELRRQLDELRAQLTAQAQRMDELQARINDLEAIRMTPSAVPAESAATLEAQSSRHLGEATAAYQQFAQNLQAAPRIDNAPLDPKYPGFFRLPGTQSFLKVGGYFKTDVLYDFKPAGDAERSTPSSFPAGVPGATTRRSRSGRHA